MIQKIKRALLTLTAGGLLFAPVLAPVSVHAAADINKGLCNGANLTASDADCDTTDEGEAANTKITNIITTVINLFSLVVGVVAVIMIIIGGLKYITSGGDSGNITGAKNTILYAVIGLVVVALAQFIVKFVLGRATKDTSGTIFLLFR
jgi:uncharacterized membrane protein